MSSNPRVFVHRDVVSDLDPYEVADLLHYERMFWSDLTLKYGLADGVDVVTPFVARALIYDILDGLGSTPEEFRNNLIDAAPLGEVEHIENMSDRDLLFRVYDEVRKLRFWSNLLNDFEDYRALLVHPDLDRASEEWARNHLDDYVPLYDYVHDRLKGD